MATGYSAFANGGYRIQPHFINRIEDAYGKVIYQNNPEYACISCISQQESNPQSADTITPDDEIIEVTNQELNPAEKSANPVEINSDYRQAQRILKSSSAYDMANILKDVIQHGTGRAALRIGRDDLGGKTGTTNDAKDAWFAGFNGKLVTVAWVGFDQPTTLGRREYGGVAALPIWTDFMAKALQGTPSAWVQLDAKAKAPIQRHQKETPQSNLGPTPPLAQPLYRPAPVVVPRAPERDFDDLPGEEETLVPKNSAPPTMQAPKEQPKPKTDALDHLIDQVQ